MSLDPDEPARAQLLRTPLRLWQRAEVHHDQLVRELALIDSARSRTDVRAVPDRLLVLTDELVARYAEATQAMHDERDAAATAGAASVDLTYVLPRSAGTHLAELAVLLDEVDDYCRDGTLLSLPASDDVAAFAAWYCAEFDRQLTHGLPPRPWPGALS
ncbi:MAG TPA: hypothetical protein VF661_04785 [Actinomycetales bacterium]